MIPQIKFKLLHPDAKLPTRAHDTDACFDVVATERLISPTGFVTYKLGFSTEMPEGWVGFFYPRSNISSQTDLILCNSVGIIDAGYRGEWEARFYAANRLFAVRHNEVHAAYAARPLLYQAGDRIGQIRFAPLPAYELVLAEELSDTTRGAGGFGSTGR